VPLSRRTFLSGSAAAGALLVASGSAASARPVLGLPLGGVEGPEPGATRGSRLFPRYRLAHADLHNHSLLSDGDGKPEEAFASMRRSGVDVAALTDHATVSKALPDELRPVTCAGDCSVTGIDEAAWRRTGELADGAQVDGSFTALRGFEWSSPTLGHVNVWFSQDWIDPLSTVGNTTGEGAAQFLHQVPGLGPVVAPALETVVRAAPTNGTGMRAFYDWLARDPATPVLSGGKDAVFGFNHPGREPGRFGYFAYDERIADRLVSVEVFNRAEDYLFEGLDQGFASPIAECLDAGWRVGLTGVSDEHGKTWDRSATRGRTGLWVEELTRAGVREAMEARRFFSTRVPGLRLDASAGGVRMGSTVGHRSGPLSFALDVDRGPAWVGKPLTVQVLQTGRPLPRVVHAEPVVLPDQTQPVLRFEAPVDVEDGRWVILRLVDPEQPRDKRDPGTHDAVGGAIAYTAPFFLDPDAAPVPVSR
jgi:hypothetical protein